MRRVALCLLLALLPTSASAVVRLEVATIDAEPGARVSLAASILADEGEAVATVGNDISFDPQFIRAIAATDGIADCAVESDIPHTLSAFFILPPGCDAGAGECRGVRALVVLFALDEPPVEGRVLYRCTFDVDAGAHPALYSLPISNAAWSTNEGVDRPLQTVGGVIAVDRDRISSPTPTPIESTPSTPPPVLAPACSGDCDASGSVDDGEESAMLTALFDTGELSACVGSPPGQPLPITAAHFLRAVRARAQGCVRSATPTRPRPSATASSTRTTTATATIPSEPPTGTPRATRTMTRTPTDTRTPRPSGTPTRTRVRTPSATRTSTRVPRTATPTPESGPQVSFLGLARGDGRLIEASGEIDGAPLYEVAAGSGFHFVVEGRPGASLEPIGQVTFDAAGEPDLQVLASLPLGDGSPRVCSGGVPAREAFDDTEENVAALNDLGCHFELGPCVLHGDGRRGLVVPQSTIQFCGLVGFQQRLARGDTVVRARLRDRDHVVGEEKRMVVRFGM